MEFQTVPKHDSNESPQTGSLRRTGIDMIVEYGSLEKGDSSATTIKEGLG